MRMEPRWQGTQWREQNEEIPDRWADMITAYEWGAEHMGKEETRRGGLFRAVSIEQGIKGAGQVWRDAFVCLMPLPPNPKGEGGLLPSVASSSRVAAQAIFGNTVIRLHSCLDHMKAGEWRRGCCVTGVDAHRF